MGNRKNSLLPNKIISMTEIRFNDVENPDIISNLFNDFFWFVPYRLTNGSLEPRPYTANSWYCVMYADMLICI